MADKRIDLTGEQREVLVEKVTRAAGGLTEQFDGFEPDAAHALMRLQMELTRYADLVAELLSGRPVAVTELLRSCAREALEEGAENIRYERRTLKQLLTGEWDYALPDTPAERAKVERQTRQILDRDRTAVVAAKAILQKVGDPMAVAV